MKEDLNGKLLQRAELVAQREELDQIFEDLKNKNLLEIQYSEEEAIVKDEIIKFSKLLFDKNNMKKKILPRLDAAINESTSLNDQTFQIDKKIQISINEKLDKMRSNSLELENLEITINNKTNELGIPELESIFEQMCSTYDNRIEKQLLTKQLSLIEEEEKNIVEKFNARERTMRDHLEQLCLKRSEYDVENEINNLNYKLDQLCIRHMVRNDAINKWKNDVKIVLIQMNDKIKNEDNDKKTSRLTQEVFLNKIEQVLKEKEINEDDQKNFKKIIQKYLDLIEKHEIFSKIISIKI